MDRRGLTLLGSGHFVIDAAVGAVPAMIPLFTAIYALSDLAASMILGASLLVSSAVQPLFGLLADRRPTPAFIWGGVAVGAAGLALSGLAGGYLGVLACIVGSGLGIAAFHPEAARVANQISAERKATGLAWFMVGGNAGFAVGPLLVALFIPLLDERATLVFLVPGAAVALWLHHERARLTVPLPTALPERARRAEASDGAPAVEGAGPWSVGLLLFVTSMRTWTQFCLLALVPLLLVDDRGFSDQAAGLMIGFGAIGSAPPGLALFGAIADSAGREAALWGVAALPLLAGALALLLPERHGGALAEAAA
jgi:FSR family fosmidomycin resistance protein-like MFS transporter